MNRLNPYPIEDPHGPGGDGHDAGDECTHQPRPGCALWYNPDTQCYEWEDPEDDQPDNGS